MWFSAMAYLSHPDATGSVVKEYMCRHRTHTFTPDYGENVHVIMTVDLVFTASLDGNKICDLKYITELFKHCFNKT